MEANLVLLAVLGLVFGGMMLLLWAGYASTEKERALQADARASEAASKPEVIVALPGFFAQPQAASAPIAFVFDDGLVTRLENHVKVEQAVVEQFVQHPSIDNLYRRPTAPVQMQ